VLQLHDNIITELQGDSERGLL